MQKYEENLAARINGNNLQPLAEASITVTDNATGLPAALYQADELTLIPQPLVTDSSGFFGFKAANGEYTLTISGSRFATFTRQITLIDPDQIAGSADNLHFIQLGAGAVARNVAAELRERVSVTQFGAVGDGVTDDSAAFQAMVNHLSAAGGGIGIAPPGAHLISAVAIKSNVRIINQGRIVQSQAPTVQAGFYKAAGSGSVSNFHIEGGIIDGARVANPGYQYNAIISVELGAGETADDITIEGAKLYDAQDHFIRVVAKHSTARGTRIFARKCHFATTPAKWSLGGTSTPVSMDGVRFEQTWDYATSGNGYGAVNFKDVGVIDCTAESIRTLADFKRGCSHFIDKGNHTKNMYDCHHSADGSFFGVMDGNTFAHDPGYTGPSTLTNFIEVQGEHIVVSNNTGDGGGLIKSGIFVTDYGRDQENGAGHRSVAVSLLNNNIKGIEVNALRILNGVSCSIRDGHVENIGAHVATIESGTGRTDGTNPLAATGCVISGVSNKNAALGVKISGSGHVKGINPDENGQDNLYCPGFALASTYGNFINEGAVAELNPNPWLEINATTNKLKWFIDHVTTATLAASKPLGAPQAVTLNDDVTNNIRQHTIDCFIPATVGSRLYVRAMLKKNSADNCGLIVQEYDAAGVSLSSTFYGGAAPVNWTEYMIAFKATNANVAYLRVGLLPATANNTLTTVGTTDFAKVSVRRAAIGV